MPSKVRSSPFVVVDGVSEAGCVYDAEPQLDPFLLDADCVLDNVDCLMDPIWRHKHTQSLPPKRHAVDNSHALHEEIFFVRFLNWVDSQDPLLHRPANEDNSSHLERWELSCLCRVP